MKLYIGRNAYNTRDQTLEFYGEVDTWKEMSALCIKYVNEKGYGNNKYWRWLCDKDQNGAPMWIVDFGSWSQFFYICDLNGELLEDWNELSKGNLE